VSSIAFSDIGWTGLGEGAGEIGSVDVLFYSARAYYNKYGKKTGDALAGDGGLEQAGEMFAKLFGGERFYDWVGEIS
jgi:hypothetical protein